MPDGSQRMPPGPSYMLLHMRKVIHEPYNFMLDCFHKFGDPYTIHDLSNGPVVVTVSPAGARQIFSADPDTFDIWGREMMVDLLGDDAVLSLSGPRHKNERKLLMPPFHGARMKSYGETMQAIAVQRALRWSPSQEFVMQEATQDISLSVIMRTVFGLADEERMERCRRAVFSYVNSVSSLVVFFKGLRKNFFGIGPWAKFIRKRKQFSDLLFEEIDLRRNSGVRGDDILSLLLDARYDDGSAMTRDAIRDELVTMLFAGHETTAIALAWAFYWIHTNPEILARLEQEITGCGGADDFAAINKLPYLDAVCNETLRIYPIAPIVFRRLTRPFVLGDYELPAGMGVAAALGAIHRRADIYPDPEKFMPERFLDRTYSPFEFFPFGGGTRRCLGAAFAMYEMKIVLATYLMRYRFELVGKKPLRPVRRNVTLGPETGVIMRVTSRN